MLICSNCLHPEESITTLIQRGRRMVPSGEAFIVCCDSPHLIEIEDGELQDYEEAYNETGLDLTDLTQKEETILGYLAETQRIIYADSEIFEGQSADSVVYDKQLWLDIL